MIGNESYSLNEGAGEKRWASWRAGGSGTFLGRSLHHQPLIPGHPPLGTHRNGSRPHLPICITIRGVLETSSATVNELSNCRRQRCCCSLAETAHPNEAMLAL